MHALKLSHFLILLLPYLVQTHSTKDLEIDLGQLLYVNVDGFGVEKTAIHDTYVVMVKTLNIGGVLAHFGSEDVGEIRQAVARMKAEAPRPLWVGIDFARIKAPLSGAESWVGFGFGAGLLGVYGRNLPQSCLEELVYLQVLLHQALGLNHALGPTVDRSRRFGFLDQDASTLAPQVESLLESLRAMGLLHAVKHFPFTPDTFSLHETSLDISLSREEVFKKVAIFQAIASRADMIMSTHLFNSEIDKDHLVTFSPIWLHMLKEQGFKGLLITDALLMIRDYEEPVRQMKTQWNTQGDPSIQRLDSIFAIQAIMAGHDLVILEGTAQDTQAVHADLSLLLRQETPLGVAFRDRVKAALRRIERYKKLHMTELSADVAIPEALTERIVLLFNQILLQASNQTGEPTSQVCNHAKVFENIKQWLNRENPKSQ